MTAYFRCSCGKNKLLIKRLKAEGYDVRVTNLNPEWKTEAASYRTRMPFKVTNGVVERL